MFYSKTAALAQHVGEITKILQEIYRDTDKKILDIELRNRAQCLILLGYTLRRRKTNKPFVPAEKSEWIQLYNNGACAMKDYCDMGMQVYVAKKCEDVKCLIVPGCAGGGGGGGGGSNKSGGIDLLQKIKVKYERATQLNENYNNNEMDIVFENLTLIYEYLINNCEKIMNDEDCKDKLINFYSSYKLLLDIVNILEYSVEELNEYVTKLVQKINIFCTNELLHYNRILPKNLNQEILRKTNFITENQIIVQDLIKEFNYTLRRRTNKVEKKLSNLQDITIEILKLTEKIYSFNIDNTD